MIRPVMKWWLVTSIYCQLFWRTYINNEEFAAACSHLPPRKVKRWFFRFAIHPINCKDDVLLAWCHYVRYPHVTAEEAFSLFHSIRTWLDVNGVIVPAKTSRSDNHEETFILTYIDMVYRLIIEEGKDVKSNPFLLLLPCSEGSHFMKRINVKVIQHLIEDYLSDYTLPDPTLHERWAYVTLDLLTPLREL